MSIESSLKTIATSLESMAESLKTLADTTPAPVNLKPGPVHYVPETTPEPATGQVVEPNEPPPASQNINPVTTAELEAFNTWLKKMAEYLNDDGSRIFGAIRKHNVKSLSDIGDNRALLDAIRADVEALEPQ